MRGEDDILAKRNNSNSSMMDSERSISGISTKSVVSAVSTDARIISNATSQATIAARSILVSGGTEETAIRTAKAAAQAVLQTHYEGQRGKANGFVLRRKIKKQADVIASMALVNASNSVNNNQWDDLGGNGAADDDGRLGRSIRDSPKEVSAANKTPAPVKGSKPNRNVSNVKRRGNTPRKARNSKPEDTIREEHAILSDETSDPEISRPVAIRVETRKRATSPFNPLRINATAKSPVASIQKIKSPQAASPRNRNLAASLPSEDPIYEVTSNTGAPTNESSDGDDDSEAHDDDKLGTISSVSTDSDGLKESQTRAAGASTAPQQDFMEATVDPYVFGCTDVFRCFGPSSSAPSRAREVESGSALLFDDSLAASQSGAALSDRVETNPSSSSSEEEEFFSEKHYDKRAISQESSDSSVESEKPRTRKETLRQKMKKIISKSKGRTQQRVAQRRSVSSSFSSEGRDDYSSDSRDDAESGGDSDDSSESSESEESRRRTTKGSGFGRKAHQQRRRNSAEKNAYY